jgi:sortase (surface protein transpeptidase)
MTRLGRSAWWAVASAAVIGLLISLVVATGSDDLQDVAQVRGDSAASSGMDTGTPPVRNGGGRAHGGVGSSAAAVGRTDASLGARPARRTPAPTRVRVPALGLETAVRPVGVGEDRQMQLPADPRVLGWYRFGAGPGGRGSVVLAGHVDSRRFGVGPLADLRGIAVGDRVEVATSAGPLRTYRVDSIETFDRQALPADVFARTGPERLRLVTCTGAYLPQAGGYQENLVVTAVPV